jgi:hypothetical protein
MPSDPDPSASLTQRSEDTPKPAKVNPKVARFEWRERGSPLPQVGAMFKRPHWDAWAPSLGTVKMGDVTVQRSVNYQCHGTHGPEQDVEFLGVYAAVYLGWNQALTPCVSTWKELDPEIEKTVLKLRAMCQHPNIKSPSSGVFDCPDCDFHAEYDTSG